MPEKSPADRSLERPGGRLAASVAPAGGELSSLRVRQGGAWRELLHFSQSGWRGGAPWLFPAVGRSFRGEPGRWSFRGRALEMPIHGFVMERPWTLEPAGEGSVVCRTASDGATRKLYPFDFELSAAYSLTERGLLARATVLAGPGNEEPMPFSIGNHLTLAVDDAARCVVTTPAKERLCLDERGLLTGKREPVAYGEGRKLVEDPALRDQVLGGYGEQAWTKVRLGDDLELRVGQRGAPQPRFVFYSDGKTFLCPEPWCGEPDSLNTGRGLVRLAPGENFSWEMSVELV